MRFACFMSRSWCTLSADKSFGLLRERRNEALQRESGAAVGLGVERCQEVTRKPTRSFTPPAPLVAVTSIM
jgi:hypothetical protein